MLVTSALLLALLTTAATDEVTLRVDIKKGGELRWSDDPCLVQARDAASGEVVATDERGESVVVVKGRAVEVIVGCKAAEGTVRRVVKSAAKKDETLAVAFAPGFVIATIDRDGTKSAGVVVVYDANNVEVARGADRAALAVDAGKVRVVGLIDRGGKQPIRGEVAVVVKTGAKTEATIDASDGELTVTVTDNGKPAHAVIALREPGQYNRLLELVAGTPTHVPSGTWDVVTQLEDSHDFREQLTKGVVVAPRKLTVKVIAHSTGTLTPVTTPATGVLVELMHPGADVAFNQLESGAPARLSPGRYVVRATGEAVLDDGAKPTISVTQTVGAGSNAKVALKPAVADLDIEVRIGGEAAVLPVSLTLPAAEAAFVTKTSDAAGKVAFVVAPQKLVVSTTLNTAHGPLELTKPVTLTAGKNRLRLDFNVGSAVMQVFDGGKAVVADAAYFQRLKSGLPDGEAVVTVKSGEQARLAPGIYVIAVTKKGEQRLFGEARIAAGGTLERALEWAPPTEDLLPATPGPTAAPAKSAPLSTKATAAKKP